MSLTGVPATGRHRVVLLNYMDIRNPRSGGAERVCFEVAKRLVQRGFEVTWITSNYPGGEAKDSLDGVRILRAGSMYTTFLRSIRIYQKQFRDATVIESINTVPYFMKFFTSRRPVLLIYHIVPLRTIVRKLGLLAPLLYFLQSVLGPRVAGDARVVTISPSTADDLKGLGYTAVTVGRMGSDPPQSPALHKERLIAIAGPLRPWKRIHDGIRAFARLPADWRLEIMGFFESPAYEEELHALVQDLGISQRVNFRGHVSDADKVCLYSRAQVLLVTSEKEGWSITAMEAQLYGCVVVGYDVPGVRDCVKNGVSAVLVPDGDIDRLGRELAALLLDPTRIQRMSLVTAERFRGRTWDEFFDDFVKGAGGCLDFGLPQVFAASPRRQSDPVAHPD